MNTSVCRRISVHCFRNCLISGVLLGSVMVASGLAQSATGAIRLVPQDRSHIQTAGLPSRAQAVLAQMPANFYHLGVATAGKTEEPQVLTLQFAASTTITGISSTRDFEVLQGGSCEESRSYVAGSTCQVVARFTPQGPGQRLGKLTLTTSDGPVSFGLIGYSYIPVISFTPSVITTVPATVSSGVGLINGAQNITIDGGDSLYIADTGHNEIRYMDSSGVLRTLASGYPAPLGIALDTFGDVYFDEPASNEVLEIYNYATSAVELNGTGADSCPASAPCYFYNEAVFGPGAMSMDGNNNLFVGQSESGNVVWSAVQPEATYANIDNPFVAQESFPDAFAVDSSDNQYSFWHPSIYPNCQIVGQTLYDAENYIGTYNTVAGGRTCGFSGDGGQARGAEISTQVGQIAFDTAGNMYFSDEGNSRVRRVDASTGIIRTIAGNGSNGYKGDGGAATKAALASPSGVTVDSEGEVYILAHSATSGTAQVVRKVGITGDLAFPSTAQGASSATLLLNVANTGNETLSFVRDTITGTDKGDFSIDNNTTSCNFAAGNYLYGGESCQIGVIFKPAAVGARSATLNLVDNTVNSVNKVTLTGTGTTAAIVKFTSPTSSQALTAGSNISVAVLVTAAKGPAPTGDVKFLVDGKSLGSVAIVSGTAAANAGSLAAGTHQLVAEYSGDKYHPASKASEKITVSQ